LTKVVGYQVENIGGSVIIPELQFFQIEREIFFGDAMVFDEPLLGPTPESL